MKPRTLALALTLTVLAPLASFGETPPAEPTVKAFGGRVTGTEHLEAEVTAIDVATRALTLKGPGGGEISLTVAPEVRNFDTMKVGDRMDLVTTEEVTIIVTNVPGEPERTDTVDVARAAPGEKPGLVVVKRATGAAIIDAIDYEKRTATLRGPNRTVTIEASAEAKNFNDAKVGDRVLIDYVQTILISVHTP